MEQLILGLLSIAIMGLVLYLLGVSSASTQPYGHLEVPFKRVKMDKAMIASVVFFSLMCGLRYRFGADCESYARGMETIARGSGRQMEFLYVWLTKILYFMGMGRVIYLGVLAGIQAWFLWAGFRTRKYLLPYIGLVLILGQYFGEWNNGIRQIIAGLMFLYAMIRLVDERDFRGYILLIILAMLFHKSAIVLLVFMVLYKYDYIPNRYLALGVLAFCFFLGESSILDRYLAYGEQLLAYLGYHNYSGDYEQIMGRSATITHIGPRQLSLLFTDALIIWFSPKIYEASNRDRLFSVGYLLMLGHAYFSQLLLNKSFLFSRPLLYLLPFVLLCTAYMLDYLRRFERKKIFFWFALAMACCFSALGAVANAGSPTETAIYKFIFLR